MPQTAQLPQPPERQPYRMIPSRVEDALTPVDRVIALLGGKADTLAEVMGLTLASIYRLRGGPRVRGNNGFFAGHHIAPLKASLEERFGPLPEGFLTEAGSFADPREGRS